MASAGQFLPLSSIHEDLSYLAALSSESAMMLDLNKTSVECRQLFQKLNTEAFPALIKTLINATANTSEIREEEQLSADPDSSSPTRMKETLLREFHKYWFSLSSSPTGGGAALFHPNLAMKRDGPRYAHLGAQEIIPNLFLGPAPAALIPNLAVLGMTHVLCCYQGKSLMNKVRGQISFSGERYSREENQEEDDPETVYDNVLKGLGIHRLLLPMPDEEDEDLSQFFDQATSFIDFALRLQSQSPGRVLVHCKLGRHRSAAMVAAYLIKFKKMKAAEALSLVSTKRKNAEPIPIVVTALEKLERSVLSQSK